MKKINLAFLSLAAILTVTGCKAAESSTKVDTRYYTPITEVRSTRKTVALFVKGTFKIETMIKPFEAFDTPLNYSSSNKSVATVDKEGKITAKKAGSAVISIFTNDFQSEEDTPKLIDKIEVYVVDKIKKAEMKAACSKMIRYHNTKCESPQNVRLHDYRIYDLIRDGVSEDRTEEYQTYVVSKPHGLMSYNSFEKDIHTTNGATSYFDYGYTAYTSPLYGSYIYHRSNDVKKYYYAATESARTTKTRYETMCGVLDALFSVDNSYFTGSMEDIEDLSDLSDAGFSTAGTYEKGDDYYLYTTYAGSAPNYSSTSVEDEIRYATQLPVGIPYDLKVSLKTIYVNGFVKELFIDQSRMFNWKGARYQYQTIIKFSYDIISDDEAATYIPGDDYEQVDYYYDI